MSFLWAIIAGLVIGLLAKLVIPGRQPIPLWLTIILGIVGGIVGNLLASGLGVGMYNAAPSGPATNPGVPQYSGRHLPDLNASRVPMS